VHPSPEASGPVDSETLFKRHAAFVASFLYRLGARESEIDDLVQDVFLSAHRKGGYAPGPASPTTFLARLALEARLAKRRNESRWRRNQREDVALATVGTRPQDPSGAFAEKLATMKLQRALEAIEPGRRAVFVLFELVGESCESIAAGLGLRVGTVHSRLHAARKAFRAHVARTQDKDDPLPVLGSKEEIR